MTDLQKRLVYSLLSALVNAAVAYLSPELRPAALAVFTFTMGHLHFTKPGDVSAVDHKAAVADAVADAVSDLGERQ